MTELDTRCLDAFPQWIRSLAEDATALAQLLSTDSLPQDARSFDGNDEVKRYVTSGLNFIFKSLDLIPDGLEGLGFLDDAFVLRVAAGLAVGVPKAKDADMRGVLTKLANDTGLIEELLGKDNERLVRYVRDLTISARSTLCACSRWTRWRRSATAIPAPR